MKWHRAPWRRPEEDWVYLTLGRCLGRNYGYFDLREADLYEPPVDKGFTAVGYSAGRHMLDPGCVAHADRTVGRAWLHDCALLPGDSGGPIVRGGTLTVVALAGAYRAQSNDRACIVADDPFLACGFGCANVAMPISSAIRNQIYAVGVQRALIELGNDAGLVGTIEGPRATAAIRAVDGKWAGPRVPM